MMINMPPINTPYKHLFFDLDHTLWDFKSNSARAIEQCLTQLQLLDKVPSFQSFFAYYESTNSRLWEEYRQRKTTKEQLLEQRFAEPFAHFKLACHPQQTSQLYMQLMSQQNQLMPHTKELLEVLHTKGFTLHIISNGFIETQAHKLQSAGIHHYFQTITLSEQVGSAKPKPAIFAHALKNTNASKKNSIMIGDDWTNDVLGALRFGIDAILLQTNKANYAEVAQCHQKERFWQLELQHPQKKKCYQVESLIDILAIVL